MLGSFALLLANNTFLWISLLTAWNLDDLADVDVKGLHRGHSVKETSGVQALGVLVDMKSYLSECLKLKRFALS